MVGLQSLWRKILLTARSNMAMKTFLNELSSDFLDRFKMPSFALLPLFWDYFIWS